MRVLVCRRITRCKQRDWRARHNGQLALLKGFSKGQNYVPTLFCYILRGLHNYFNAYLEFSKISVNPWFKYLGLIRKKYFFSTTHTVMLHIRTGNLERAELTPLSKNEAGRTQVAKNRDTGDWQGPGIRTPNMEVRGGEVHPGPWTGLQATQDLRRGHVDPKPHTQQEPSQATAWACRVPSSPLEASGADQHVEGQGANKVSQLKSSRIHWILYFLEKKKVEKMHYQIEPVALSNPNLVGLWITGLDWQDMRQTGTGQLGCRSLSWMMDKWE